MTKSGVIDWLKGNLFIDRKDYFDLFILQGNKKNESLTSNPKLIAKWYSKDSFFDQRNYIINKTIDVVIIDGISILFSPYTNYNNGRDFEDIKCTLFGTSNYWDITYLDVLSGFLKILLGIIKERNNCSTIIINFDKSDNTSLAKRYTWFKRDLDKSNNKKYLYIDPIVSFYNKSNIGEDESGNIDYFHILKNRKNRERFIIRLCNDLINEFKEGGLFGIERDPVIIFDFKDINNDKNNNNNLSLNPIILIKDTKTINYIQYTPSDDWFNSSNNIGEADISIIYYLYKILFSNKKNFQLKQICIEIIGNDEDVFTSILSVIHRTKNSLIRNGYNVDIFYRQIGGNSLHLLFNMNKIYNAMLTELNYKFNFKGSTIFNYDGISNQKIKNRLFMDFIFLSNLAGNDKIINLKGFKLKTLYAAWFKMSKITNNIFYKDIVPVCIDFRNDIALMSQNKFNALVYMLESRKYTMIQQPIDLIKEYSETKQSEFIIECKTTISQISFFLFYEDMKDLQKGKIKINDIFKMENDIQLYFGIYEEKINLEQIEKIIELWKAGNSLIEDKEMKKNK